MGFQHLLLNKPFLKVYNYTEDKKKRIYNTKRRKVRRVKKLTNLNLKGTKRSVKIRATNL